MPIAHYRGTSNVLFTNPTARIVSSAGGLSLAALLAVSGVASAAPLPTFGYSLVGDELTANVTGDIRTGVWRIRLVSPSGDKRIEFMLQKGDVSWSGVVRVSRRLGNSWSLVSRHRLDDAFAGGSAASACQAGVCWSSDSLRLPRNGDGRFGVTVRLTQAGSYRLSGAVREASEPFIYDSWLVSSARSVVH
jgi:hypothetical protein